MRFTKTERRQKHDARFETAFLILGLGGSAIFSSIDNALWGHDLDETLDELVEKEDILSIP